jgi:hypothetical protein
MTVDRPTMVTARSRRYVRSSVVVLVLALALAGSVMLVGEDRYAQLQDDFADNDLLHTIEITGRVDERGQEPLHAPDGWEVRAVVGAVDPSADARVVELHTIAFGVLDRTGAGDLFVAGLLGPDADRFGGSLLGVGRLEPATGYAVTGVEVPTPLQVPVVGFEDGGFVSADAAEFDLLIDASVDTGRLRSLVAAPGGTRMLVVGDVTFRLLAETMFDGAWEQITAEGSPVGPGVQAIYVRVASLDDVDAVAEALESEGFVISYPLAAFDDLSDSLRTTIVLGAVIVAFTLVGAALVVATSWNAYFRLSRRDMGILRHFGYPERVVFRTYASRVARSCATALFLAGLVIGCGGVLLLGPGALPWTALNLAVLCVIVTLVHLLVTRAFLARHVRCDVLDLLRNDRQFQ